ncbi:hypothetical protein DP49_7137 [Burkholderia pseudomallei]|nr:hypothetical protein DP49_7137 [Burkholderia pseudomallei]
MPASVAPPSAWNAHAPPQRARNRAGRSSAIQSPDASTARTLRHAPAAAGAASAISSSAGAEFHSVTRCRSISSIQRAASRASSCVGNTSAPPAPSTPNKSYTDRSKSSADTASNRSSALTPSSGLIASIVFIAASCVISTPFGTPVEPDV